ncbi:MAG: rRNA maturation RNase YbeY [Cyanosarcina radialis HA8281-LM2]|nr:rRNA maturation RNase YbeY [Cyanosarcina radialis HA8281-LM2]
MLKPVPVEINVQDCYSPVSESPLSDTAEPGCIISAAIWETWFQKWVGTMSGNLPPADLYELSLRLTTDAEIRSLNAQYRHQDRPTDVLAFAALEVNYPQLPESLPLYLGDIVISVETAKRQAKEREHSLTTELAWLATHGLLHLLGWDHPDADSLTRMLQQQEVLLKTVGLNSESHTLLV